MSAWIEIDNAIGMPLIVEVALLVSAWIEITEVGGDAYKRNSLDIRVIDRFGVEAWDTAAVIAAKVIVDPKTV